MKKILIKAANMPKWARFLSDLQEETRQLVMKRTEESEAHNREVSHRWSLREGSFWLRPIGVRLYDEINKSYQTKLSAAIATLFINSLENTIDQWDSFIEKAVKTFRESKNYSSWENMLRRRDSNACKMCGNKQNVHIHTLVSLSERIAEKTRDACIDIQSVDVSNDSFFYDQNLGLVLCSKCYYPEWGDALYDTHKMQIEDVYIEAVPLHGIFFKLNEIFREVDNHFLDASVAREWFASQLQKVTALECEIGEMPNGRGSSGAQLRKIDLLLRSGEYESGRRWAMRQENFYRMTKESKHKIYGNPAADSFVDRKREKTLNQYLDDLIEQYKRDRFSIRFSRAFGRLSR